MTALKPIENRRVRGVAAESYPSNLICAHPDCSERVDLRPSGEPTVHHIFPRSLTKSSSYFVEIVEDDLRVVIPHAVGLCGSGTTGHHGDVEEHRAWIKLEEGEYVWYDRVPHEEDSPLIEGEKLTEFGRNLLASWEPLGPLNPQPGSVDGKPKKKRTQKGTQERAARKTVSVRLPEGTSGDDWDELLEEAEKVELSQPDSKFNKALGGVTVGKLLVAVLERFTGRVE